MTVTLTLTPELQAELVAQAQANGKSLEDYLVGVVEGAMVSANPETLPPEQRAAAFEAWSERHRPTAPLSDYAVGREAMYDGRNG